MSRNLLPLYKKLSDNDFRRIAYVLKWEFRSDKYYSKWKDLAPTKVPKSEILLVSAADVLFALKNEARSRTLELLIELYVSEDADDKSK